MLTVSNVKLRGSAADLAVDNAAGQNHGCQKQSAEPSGLCDQFAVLKRHAIKHTWISRYRNLERHRYRHGVKYVRTG